MNNISRALSFALLMTALLLTGCVNREQADAKLAKACKAAANVFLPDGQKVNKIESTSATPSPEGQDFRHVTIHTVTVDGWLEEKSDYDCVFEEGFGFLHSNYTASIEKVTVNGDTYGRSGDEILGDAQDMIKLTNAVRDALYEN